MRCMVTGEVSRTQTHTESQQNYRVVWNSSPGQVSGITLLPELGNWPALKYCYFKYGHYGHIFSFITVIVTMHCRLGVAPDSPVTPVIWVKTVYSWILSTRTVANATFPFKNINQCLGVPQKLGLLSEIHEVSSNHFLDT